MTLAISRPLALLAGIVLVLAACAPTGVPSAAPGASGAPGSTGASGAGGGSDLSSCPTSQPAVLPAGETRTVTITTDRGDIGIKVTADVSPIAAGNFVALADCGFYDGVVFHRVIPGFIIQGGDGQYGRSPDVDSSRVGSGGPGYDIQDEPVTLPYSRGTVAMARSEFPNSAGSQFFIILDDSARTSLSANTYQIIGTVTNGMEAADAIAAAADAEIPTDPVVMNDVSVATP